MDCFPNPGVDISNVVWDTMSLYDRLVKEKDRLGKKALRFPKTNQELLDRKRWERIYIILTRRYEFGMEDAMDRYRRQDQLDEIVTIKRP
tara:strand:- start:411 stop:680 length:270 start_codon:yes stop_codon:yes gene_type:complete